MKVSMVSEDVKITGSAKKLKQARLPFQTISPGETKPISPAPRKRKLSTQNDEVRSKIGKNCVKENELSEAETTFEISDDEVIESDDVEQQNTIRNPMVRLVDIALKKRKSKHNTATKKKKHHVRGSNMNDGRDEDREAVGDQCEAAVNSAAEECAEECAEVDIKVVSVLEERTNGVGNICEDPNKEFNCSGNMSNSCTENIHSSYVPNEDASEDCAMEVDPDLESVEKKVPTETAGAARVQPKRAASSDSAARTPKSTEVAASLDAKKLTPKQLERKLESIKRQQERDQERLLKEQERLTKSRLKQEKEEQKKKEREEKEDLRMKEKEEREKARLEEKKLKESKEQWRRQVKEMKESQKKQEKEMREEEKKKRELEKEEEKRRRDQEKEEIENKMKKASQAFVNFFVPKEKHSESKELVVDKPIGNSVSHSYLSNFRVKSDMRLAPIVRGELDSQRKSFLDSQLKDECVENKKLYIDEIKASDYSVKSCGKTWAIEDLKNDCTIIEDDLPPIDDSNQVIMEGRCSQLRAKLLGFAENRRPPYWGTWRRASRHISGRRPFAMDKFHLDYECDSDEEWEEEEPGESVGGSGGGSQGEEGEDEYDVDNDFMVPHGYLSEEEAIGEEDDVVSPETQKAKLMLLEDEFKNERKKTTERLQPRLLGIVWQDAQGSKPAGCTEAVWNFFNLRKIVSFDSQIAIQPAADNESEQYDTAKKLDKSIKKSTTIKEEMIPDLIRLLHCNTNNKGFLASEFKAFITRSTTNTESETNPGNEGNSASNNEMISKISIARKIKEISKWTSCPDEGVMQAKHCWFVSKEVRDEYGLAELTTLNSWVYALTPKRKSTIVKQNSGTVAKANEQVSDAASAKKDSSFNITKFTKKMNQEEREKQFSTASTAEKDTSVKIIGKNIEVKVSVASSNINVVAPNVHVGEKKRVSLLCSGPRGMSLPSSKHKNEEKVKGNEVLTSPRLIDSSLLISQDKDLKNEPISHSSGSHSLINEDKARKPVEKKRVSLISLPLSNVSPRVIKTNLLTQFIKTMSKNNEDRKISGSAESPSPAQTDDCIVLSD